MLLDDDMQKKRAAALLETAAYVAGQFSAERARNYGHETYTVHEIVLLSESTALVIYDKAPTGKRAVCWFYYIDSGLRPRWAYFFLTYSHLAGLEESRRYLHAVEQFNFQLLASDAPPPVDPPV